jgi:hypothetical protein
MLNDLPPITESVLDLFNPAQLQQALVYQTQLDESVDDWESRHLHAAECLCLYAELTYPKQLNKYAHALRKKLNLLGDDE